MLAFRSLDPFRALREPDRRRRDEERLSRSEQRTLSKNPKQPLDRKSPIQVRIHFPPAGSQKRTVRHLGISVIDSTPRRASCDLTSWMNRAARIRSLTVTR